MLWIALAGFVIAAIGGAIMAQQRIVREHNPNRALVSLHGMAAVFGLVGLIVMLPGDTAPLVTACFIAFVVVAAAGIALLSFDARGKLIPRPLLVGHALLAIAALLLLAYAGVVVKGETPPHADRVAGNSGANR